MNIPSNEYLISILFKICAHLGDTQTLEFGKRVLDTLPIKLENDRIVLTSALQMLIKCGDISSAEKLFSRMKKNDLTFSVMMAGKTIYRFSC